MLPPLQSGIDFLLKVKRQGYNVFILSNIVQDSLDYFKENFTEVTSVLNGAVYSCEAHLRKPDEEIYRHILSKYNLVAEETMYLDDCYKNALAACKLGIKGIHCTPIQKENEFDRIASLLEETTNTEKE